MRPQLIVGALVLSVCTTGCQLTADITRNLVFETCLSASSVRGKVYYRRLARDAWAEYLSQHPECGESHDFYKGFKLGYADYLENGGCGSNHPLPPLRYWKIRHETPEGRAATVQWLKGFQAGTATAKASGFREMIIVPVNPTGLPPKGPPPSSLTETPPPADLLPPPPAPSASDLPAPRLLPAKPLPNNAAPVLPTLPSAKKPNGNKVDTATFLQPAANASNSKSIAASAAKKSTRSASTSSHKTSNGVAAPSTVLEAARKRKSKKSSSPWATESESASSPDLAAPEATAASMRSNPH